MRFKQKNSYFCGPASLQVIFPWLEQDELAKLAGTTVHGTSVYGLKRAAKALLAGINVRKGRQHKSKHIEHDLIVYDEVRDHWMAVYTVWDSKIHTYFYTTIDPEHATKHTVAWSELWSKHLSKSTSYAIEVIKHPWMKRLSRQ